MADLFISYSRKDSEQALQLAERLRTRGIEVWIDKQRIEAAASWSKEIVRAIDECKAFMVLLSSNSIASVNVIREVGIASEGKKPMLPVALEDIKLSDDLRYHLSGIQRVAYTQFDAIASALEKFGIERNQPPPTPRLGKAGEKNPLLFKEGAGGGLVDLRKSLMILPFEDLSPTRDNGWFADGVANELISALSNVKALKVTDSQSTKDYKRYQGTLPNYAKEMGIRYFVQGDVRKFGDSIKVSARLLDIETGDHLWHDSLKGTMNDIFDIQETVAEKVVEGLKVYLASDERKKLAERGTDNAEAYELYMRASEYFLRQTKEGFQLADQLITEAMKLDTGYARAYHFKANSLAALYSSYDRTPALLDEAETLSLEALRLKPDLFGAYHPLSQIYMHRGQLAEAEKAAREFIRKDPQNFLSHGTLGFFYMETGQPAKAIAPYEEAVRLKPDDLPSLWNLVSSCDAAVAGEKSGHWALVALPYFERHLKLHPDDESMRVWYANLLVDSGRTVDAYAAAMKLTNLKDGTSLYNTACLFGQLGDRLEAIRTFRGAIEAGFRNIRLLREFLTDEKEGVLALAGTPEYEEVREMVEKIEAEAANNNG